MMTHYQVLKVSQDAPSEVINAAWKALQKLYHPDSGLKPSSRRSAEINAAHDILSDPAKRTAYDQALEAQRAAQRVARRLSSRTAHSARNSHKGHARSDSRPPVVDLTEVAVQAGAAIVDQLIGANPVASNLFDELVRRHR
jgi:curved DNA-binding protein CbpA